MCKDIKEDFFFFFFFSIETNKKNFKASKPTRKRISSAACNCELWVHNKGAKMQDLF